MDSGFRATRGPGMTRTSLTLRCANLQASRMVDFSTSVIAVRGCRIRLMRGGAGSPLVVLHGASRREWLPFMQQLAQKFDVIAPEHPGFGESDTPDWLDNIHDLAYFYLDVLDELKLKDVHLVGLSLGGWIAAELAVRNTQRLASLTLCRRRRALRRRRRAARSVPAQRRAAAARLLLRSEKGRRHRSRARCGRSWKTSR